MLRLRHRPLLVTVGLAVALAWSSVVAGGASGVDTVGPTDTTPGADPAGEVTVTADRAAKPGWVKRIDRLVKGKNVAVMVMTGDHVLYRKRPNAARTPASVQKLLMSMALLNRVPPRERLPLRLAAPNAVGANGVLRGRAWLIGSGDPGVRTNELEDLADSVAATGLRRIKGGVLASTGPFERDHWAPGWRATFPTHYVALPTALTFHANMDQRGRFIQDPERRAAEALTKALRRAGVKVGKPPKAGTPPAELTDIASIGSPPLRAILRRTNTYSWNFGAEVLGKLLGSRVIGGAGSIAKGGKAIRQFAAARGVTVVANDSSGLSYANEVSAAGVVTLLAHAEGQPWLSALRSGLAKGGKGTLEDRLKNVPIRAKTGSLPRNGTSALAGWVQLKRTGEWARFTILNRGMSKATAVRIEDGIVRIVHADGRPRT